MASLTRDLGIDLGTTNTVIAEGNQILLARTYSCGNHYR